MGLQQVRFDTLGAAGLMEAVRRERKVESRLTRKRAAGV